MEAELQRNLRYDQVSDGRRFGSKDKLHRQSRKMSIGIAAQSMGKTAKGDQTSILQHRENSIQVNNGKQGLQATTAIGNRFKLKGERGSPWITPKSVVKRTRTTKSDSRRNAKGAHSIQSISITKEPITTTTSKSGDRKLNKSHNVSSGKGNEKDVTLERAERLSSIAGKETSTQVEGVITRGNPLENNRKETLKMKLLEILGANPSTTDKQTNESRSVEVEANIVRKEEEAVPSTSKPFDDCCGGEEGANAVNLEEAPKDNPTFRTRQNSDTIESDSEDPAQPPSREKVVSKVHPKRLNKKLSYGNDENRVFSFEEKNLAANCTAKTRRRLISKGKENVTRSHMIRTTKIVDPLKDRSNIQRPVFKTNKPSQVEDISLCGGVASARELPHQVQTEKVKSKNSHYLPDPRENDHPGNWHSPMTPKVDVKESCPHEFSPTNGNQLSDCLSPEFKMNTNPEVPSPCPFGQVSEIQNQSFSSMLAARKISVKDTIRLESDRASRQNNFGSNMRVELSETPTRSGRTVTTPSQSIRNNSTESERLNLGRKDFDSTQEELFVSKGSPEDIDNSPEIVHVDESILHKSKRLCTREAVENSQVSPTLSSPNGTRLSGPSEEDQEDRLNRGIALFGYALERLKDKLVSSTKKKCSEIMASTAEEMHLKLQSAKSQIEKDLEKLTSLSGSRRQVLETRFNEQQEQLRLIHKKYRGEINRQLKEFASTVESLQAERDELRGAIERQKASHQKLLLQVEEDVKDRLGDALRRLASVHNTGRSKMQQLKIAIGECLKDEIFP